MATFTIALKDVIALEGAKNIGLDSYPIFDEKYRPALNQKIIDHFWNQEIGQETISMWRFAMRRKMNEIMPLYNQHYKLSLLNIDPLSTINIKNVVRTDGTVTADVTSEAVLTGTSGSKVNGSSETTTDGTTSNTVNGTSGTVTDGTTGGTVNGESSSTSGSNAESRAVGSQTPQTALEADADYADSMQDNVSASSATGTATEQQTTTGTNEQTTNTTDKQTATGKNAQTTNSTDEQTATGTTGQTSNGTEAVTTVNGETVDNVTTGYQGHTAELVLRARQALFNVDMMVINDLQELFMLIWSNNDSYTGRRRY